MNKIDLHQRFFEKVIVTNTCWLWKAYKNKYGYGCLSYLGKNTGAHVVAYILFRGHIPEGLQIDHLCRVKHCVNPEHLEVVTLKENINRGIRHKKSKVFCNQGHYLSDSDVYHVRKQNNKIKRYCKLCVKSCKQKKLNKSKIRIMEYHIQKCPAIRRVNNYFEKQKRSLLQG